MAFQKPSLPANSWSLLYCHCVHIICYLYTFRYTHDSLWFLPVSLVHTLFNRITWRFCLALLNRLLSLGMRPGLVGPPRINCRKQEVLSFQSLLRIRFSIVLSYLLIIFWSLGFSHLLILADWDWNKKYIKILAESSWIILTLIRPGCCLRGCEATKFDVIVIHENPFCHALTSSSLKIHWFLFCILSSLSWRPGFSLCATFVPLTLLLSSYLSSSLAVGATVSIEPTNTYMNQRDCAQCCFSLCLNFHPGARGVLSWEYNVLHSCCCRTDLSPLL